MHVLKTAFQPRLTRRRDYERCESLLASLDFRIMEQGRSPPVEKNKDTHFFFFFRSEASQHRHQACAEAIIPHKWVTYLCPLRFRGSFHHSVLDGISFSFIYRVSIFFVCVNVCV